MADRRGETEDERVGRRRRGAVAAVLAATLCLSTACADASRVQQSIRARGLSSTASRPPIDRPFPKVTPSPLPPQPVNAGFELGGDGPCPPRWSCDREGQPSATVSDDVPYSGKRALRVTSRAPEDRFTLRSGRLPALPERTYTATFWRRSSTAGPDGGESVRLAFYDQRRRLLGSQSNRTGTPEKDTWEAVSVHADAPAGTVWVEVEISVTGAARTVWLDSVSLRHSPILEVWGGTGVHRGRRADTLSFQLTTPTPGGVYIGTIDAFGQRLRVSGPRRMESERGGMLAYSLQGSARFDPSTETILIEPGEPATIEVRGRFTPTPGTGFPRATLRDPVAQATFVVFVAARNYDNGDATAQLPDRHEVQAAVERVAAYLRGRMTKSGGWAVAHPYWPGQLREDPQAIAFLVQGYLKRARATDDPADAAMARRGLDWLVRHQRKDGGFGLPWAFGSRQGHFGERAHYHGRGYTHAEGEPLAVVTIAAASALLEGFKVFGDSRYLAAALRAKDYLLAGPNGFQWLDAEKTRGSIPYCNLEPVLPRDDPRVRTHDVLPAVRNTSVEVYNIDGAALSFLTALYVETGDERLLTYGDAIATNLAQRIRPDGMTPYAWFKPSPHSGGYVNITLSGLLEYGEMRGREDWVAQAGRGFSWMANHARGDLIPTEGYASVYGLNLSLDVARYVSTALKRQKPDGSFSGGTTTRYDAVMFAILSDLLLSMGE